VGVMSRCLRGVPGIGPTSSKALEYDDLVHADVLNEHLRSVLGYLLLRFIPLAGRCSSPVASFITYTLAD
jgi:hypothetical protein